MNWIYIVGGLLILAAIMAGKKPGVAEGLGVVVDKAGQGVEAIKAAIGMAEVVVAPGSAPGSIKYPDGTVKNGGPSSWRANNPGNITYSDWAVKYAGAFPGVKLPWGKIAFAVFPSEAAGLAALRLLLTSGPYVKDTVGKAMARYLGWVQPDGTIKPPPGSVDDPVAYANGIASAVGVSTTTVVGTLTADQLDRFVAKVRAIEGWDAPGPDGKKGTVSQA